MRKTKEDLKIEREKHIRSIEAEFKHDSEVYDSLSKWFESIPKETENNIKQLEEDKEGYELMLSEGYNILQPKFVFETSKKWKEYQVRTINRKIKVISDSVEKIKNSLTDQIQKNTDHIKRIEARQNERIEQLKNYGIEMEFKKNEKIKAKLDYIG